MGAFVGTVATGVVVTRMARRSGSADVISAVGKSFSQSLNAAMGTRPDVMPPQHVHQPQYVSPALDPSRAISSHCTSLVQRWYQYVAVPSLFKLETWEQAACRIFDFEPMTWDDANTLAELVHTLKSECGTDGV